MNKNENRFQTALTESVSFGMNAKIIVDTQTGVNYLYCSSGYSGGITPLLNRDGSPIISPIHHTGHTEEL